MTPARAHRIVFANEKGGTGKSTTAVHVAVALAAAGVRLGDNYPHPIVKHDEARALTLQRYAVVKKAAEQ